MTRSSLRCSKENEVRIIKTTLTLTGGGVAAAVVYSVHQENFDCRMGDYLVEMAVKFLCSTEGAACNYGKRHRDKALFDVNCPSSDVYDALMQGAKANVTAWTASEKAAMGWGSALGLVTAFALVLLGEHLCNRYHRRLRAPLAAQVHGQVNAATDGSVPPTSFATVNIASDESAEEETRGCLSLA